MAGENMHTYVESTDGWRGMGAADGAWKVNPKTRLWTDFEYQHKVQRSEAGYQLLGGTTVPLRHLSFGDAGRPGVVEAEYL